MNVYDNGSIFSPAILDITDDDIKDKFMAGVANVAAVSLAIGYPTMASAPHSIANGMKNLLAIAAVTEITFKEAEMLKEFLADPSKFAAAAAPAAAAAAPAAAAAKVEEEEEEEDDDMGFGLFDSGYEPNSPCPIKADDIVSEVFDFVRPENPDGSQRSYITLKDLQSCKVGGTVIGICIDAQAFWAYDNRESLGLPSNGIDEHYRPLDDVA